MQVWILWVPSFEEKSDVAYSDRSVSHQNTIEHKLPTNRQIQELVEQRGQLWEDDSSFFEGNEGGFLGSSAPVAVAGRSNRKGSKSQSGPGTGNGGVQSEVRVSLEAAKFKASTVKDCGRVFCSFLLLILCQLMSSD